MTHSVWWLFAPDGAFAAWYVNLEEPGVAWDDGVAAGVDLTDHDLDIWVWPDRSWEWKDDDELEERLGFPEHYWVSEPEAVWAAGRAMIPLIEAGEYPFDGTWCDFRPDPAWTVPDRLPDGWDRPRQR
jgi:predicted RNA-binding protein associated with RNAse of E/G family